MSAAPGDGVKLDGIHHVTCITADGQENVAFYVGVMGLRLVKKTINFDVPDAYHLYFGDELGTPGSILTFFEYPNRGRGRAGAGMIHRILFRVGGDDALDFWEERLERAGLGTRRRDEGLTFEDPEGLGLGLVPDRSGSRPLAAESGDVPEKHRIRGFDGVRALAPDPGASEKLLVKMLGFAPVGSGQYAVEGVRRNNSYAYDGAATEEGVEGAGTVHHIAFACEVDDHLEWRRRLVDGGTEVTDVYDRKYFRSIYFREPSGVLFEIATRGPGFTVDEPPARLGWGLSLPAWEEHRRPHLERQLRPIVDPRSVDS